VVSAHLGAGASLAALVGGRPVDTTMGFTPLDGLVMATRCGSLDPGIVTHLIRADGIGPDEVEHALEHESGLLGLAGTADLAQVIEAARAGGSAATLGYGVYLHRLRAAVAAMVAAMGGLDVLCFTGGAGEGSAVLRADTCRGLGFLGISSLEDESGLGGTGPGDRVVSSGTGPVVAVVHTREDLVMADQAAAVLAGSGRTRRAP
jgi:acetate kinase